MAKAKKQKPKAKSPSKSVLVYILGAFLLLLVLAFLLRGWIRMTVIPKTITMLYDNSAKEAFEEETAKLQDPIKLLGYTSTEFEGGQCMTTLAKGLSTLVSCNYDIQAYREIAQDDESKTRLNQNAEKLQNLLKENGWEGEYSENGEHTSLTKLVSSITSDIDYQPDATYVKLEKHVICFVHSNTAFSKPKPPAIATQISCTRNFNILGTPRY